MTRRAFAAAAALAATALLCWPAASHAQFTPFKKYGATTESHTGLWFGTWMTSTTPILPIETLTRATKDAVTGGVAFKIIARPGSIGRVTYEHELGSRFSPSNLTFYVKASRNVTMRVFRKGKPGSTTFQATTQWKKIDISTSNVDYIMTFELDQPASSETWYILDRIGLEQSKSAPDLSGATSGPDSDISTSQLILGAQNVAAIAAKLKAKQPFKIVSLGDSVIEGTQIDLGNGYNWNNATKQRYLFPTVLGRMLEKDYGYSAGALAVHNFGAVYTADDALKQSAVQNKVLSQAGAGDLVIVELGANDLADGTSVSRWKSMLKTIIGQIKAGGVKNILFVGLTMEEPTLKHTAAISRTISELVTEEGIAALDLTKYAMFRGTKYSWADSANPSHPDASGHMWIARMITAVFSGNHVSTVNVGATGPGPSADSGGGSSDSGGGGSNDGGGGGSADGGSGGGGNNDGASGGNNDGGGGSGNANGGDLDGGCRIASGPTDSVAPLLRASALLLVAALLWLARRRRRRRK